MNCSNPTAKRIPKEQEKKLSMGKNWTMNWETLNNVLPIDLKPIELANFTYESKPEIIAEQQIERAYK